MTLCEFCVYQELVIITIIVEIKLDLAWGDSNTFAWHFVCDNNSEVGNLQSYNKTARNVWV